MSLLARLEKLEKTIKPRIRVMVVNSEAEITDEPHVVWVLINL